MSHQREQTRSVERRPSVLLVTLTTGGTTQRITDTARYVRAATIQNISTENVTLFTFAGGAGGSGVILNAAVSGAGGGSLDLLPNNPGNEVMDLSQIYFVRATGGLTLAIYYEQVK